jgi:hypothetical protein
LRCRSVFNGSWYESILRIAQTPHRPRPHSDPAPGAAAGAAPFPRRTNIPGLYVVTQTGDPHELG